MSDNIQIMQLSTQQLEKKLKVLLNAEYPDEVLVRQILKELEQRNTPTDIENPTVQAAWRKYLQSCAEDEKQRAAQRARIHKRWMWGSVAAAVVLIVIFMAAPQRASAESIWERLVRWTDSVFEFFNFSDAQVNDIYTTDHMDLRKVYDAVANLGVTEPVVPTWIPKEYALKELKNDEQPGKKILNAVFVSEENKIIYTIKVYDEATADKYAKNSAGGTNYEVKGIVHYIIDNDGATTAVWVVDNIECSISTDGQEDVLLPIIDSIYEMRGNI